MVIISNKETCKVHMRDTSLSLIIAIIIVYCLFIVITIIIVYYYFYYQLLTNTIHTPGMGGHGSCWPPYKLNILNQHNQIETK